MYTYIFLFFLFLFFYSFFLLFSLLSVNVIGCYYAVKILGLTNVTSPNLRNGSFLLSLTALYASSLLRKLTTQSSIRKELSDCGGCNHLILAIKVLYNTSHGHTILFVS